MKMRWPGIEPGSVAWKATMLTITPPTLLERGRERKRKRGREDNVLGLNTQSWGTELQSSRLETWSEWRGFSVWNSFGATPKASE